MDGPDQTRMKMTILLQVKVVSGVRRLILQHAKYLPDLPAGSVFYLR